MQHNFHSSFIIFIIYFFRISTNPHHLPNIWYHKISSWNILLVVVFSLCTPNVFCYVFSLTSATSKIISTCRTISSNHRDSRTNLDLDSQTIRTTKLRLRVLQYGSIENLLAIRTERPVDITALKKIVVIRKFHSTSLRWRTVISPSGGYILE